MDDIGEVIAVKDNVIKIQFLRKPSCKRCGLCMTCEDEKKMVLELNNSIGAEVGDNVKVSVPQGSLLFASFLVYIMPLLGFTLAIVISQYFLRDRQELVLLIGFIGLFSAFAVIKYFDYYFERKQKMNMVVEKIK
ncbi:MAG: SoxR reducing system RseC family protein [bacterium]